MKTLAYLNALNAPPTGDTSQPLLYAGIALAAAVIIILIIVLKRRKDGDDDE